MEQQLIKLITKALKLDASDIHLDITPQRQLKIIVRARGKMLTIKETYPIKLFHYLKYRANLDLANSLEAQSGAFELTLHQHLYFFRFSCINNLHLQSGVLRILNNHKKLKLTDLTTNHELQKIFVDLCRKSNGFALFSGPTGSGKSTTIYTLLETIALQHQFRIITIEDPIEVKNDHFLQLQVNEASGFTYAAALKSLLRHDYDVLFVGEIRDEASAQHCFRAALSGHLVFATIHARNNLEALKRLQHFQIPQLDLQNTLTHLFNQRFFPGKKKLTIYEYATQDTLQYLLQHQTYPPQYQDIHQRINHYQQQGDLDESCATKEL